MVDTPQNVKTEPFNANVTVSWDAVPDVRNYIVEYSGAKNQWIRFDTSPSTDNTRTVTPLVNNQLYRFRVIAVGTDGAESEPSDTVKAVPVNEPKIEYCTVSDIADWLRIDINANTDPRTSMVENLILNNQERIDRLTGHTWQSEKQYRYEIFDINRIWHFGKGMPLYLKHRQMKLPFDETKGDLFEIWNGIGWQRQDVGEPTGFINFEPSVGTFYIRGYFFNILKHGRFRLTYRYGGDQEGTPVARDLKKACILMTSINFLSTDFTMS